MDLNGYKEIRDAYRTISESLADAPAANTPAAAAPDAKDAFPKDRVARAKKQASVKKEELEATGLFSDSEIEAILEDAEQLDELSNRKLMSYRKKALKDGDKKQDQALKHTSDSIRARSSGNYDAAKELENKAAKATDKAYKRREGAMKAAKATRKEEVEISEAEGMHRDAKTGEVVKKAEIGKTYYPNMPKQKTSVKKKPDAFGGRFNKEEAELDTFDIILEYLMGRGFPQEDAMQLMATMDGEKRTKILGEAMGKAKEEAKHDEKLAKKDEEEAEYDTKKGKGKRAKELDDDAKQDDADAAEDVKNEAVSWDKYGRPKSKEGKAKAARAQAEMRAKDKAAGRDRYGYKTGYAKKTWDE